MGRPSFIPGAHYHALTPWYEALVRPFVRTIWRRLARVISDRAPRHGAVADIGCGPGTVLRAVRSARSDLLLTGIDIDARMLEIAKQKADGGTISFLKGSADTLPLKDASTDVLLSSFVFHHLSDVQKEAALQETKRVLRDGGTFLLCDFSVPRTRLASVMLRILTHSEPGVAAQARGQLRQLAVQAGAETQILAVFYGCITVLAIRFP